MRKVDHLAASGPSKTMRREERRGRRERSRKLKAPLAGGTIKMILLHGSVAANRADKVYPHSSACFQISDCPCVVLIARNLPPKATIDSSDLNLREQKTCEWCYGLTASLKRVWISQWHISQYVRNSVPTVIVLRGETLKEWLGHKGSDFVTRLM